MADITSLTSLRKNIRQLVEYAWSYELEDYDHLMAATGEPPRGHIFNTLVALDNWLNGTEHVPMHHVEEARTGRGGPRS